MIVSRFERPFPSTGFERGTWRRWSTLSTTLHPVPEDACWNSSTRLVNRLVSRRCPKTPSSRSALMRCCQSVRWPSQGESSAVALPLIWRSSDSRASPADDRVLLVGDARQHHAVDAGQPYRQLQDAGLATARLDDIVRQNDPALRAVVEQLSHGDVRGAIERLDQQGRVHEIADRDARLHAMAHEYLRNPSGTLVVSPDNQSRSEINQVIHAAVQDAGIVDRTEHRVRILLPRQDVTGADRQWAEKYEPGNVVRYTRGSDKLGLDAGAYARVVHAAPRENLITVEPSDGQRRTYDPRRLQGVMLYREADRAFAVGDRVQFTAPDRTRHVANREVGTIETIDAGKVQVRLDSGRSVSIPASERLHLDHGYAVTSHSSQGQTADRVLVHVDTDRVGEQLVNRRLAYVAISRGRHDAQIYTNDKTRLASALDRDVAHRSALDVAAEPARAGRHIGPDRKCDRRLAVLPRDAERRNLYGHAIAYAGITISATDAESPSLRYGRCGASFPTSERVESEATYGRRSRTFSAGPCKGKQEGVVANLAATAIREA
jgi:AAA domain/UvrD-like helicase C-terminal domain